MHRGDNESKGVKKGFIVGQDSIDLQKENQTQKHLKKNKSNVKKAKNEIKDIRLL
jgi:hypothetical protein